MKWFVLAALLAASPARADVQIAGSPEVTEKPKPKPPEEQWYPRISAGAGIGYFLGKVGVLHPTGATVELTGELTLTPSLFLRLGYEHAWLTARDEILTSHVGANLDGTSAIIRHAIFGFGEKDVPISGDMFVLAGVEYERIAFDGAKPLRRYEAVIGFGGAVVIADKRKRPYQLIEYGLRMMFSRAPDPGKLPFGCDGPCDMPTKTAPYDHTMVMEVSWQFGR